MIVQVRSISNASVEDVEDYRITNSYTNIAALSVIEENKIVSTSRTTLVSQKILFCLQVAS